MKCLPITTLLLAGSFLIATSAHAASDNCKNMARELTMTAWNEVLTDMTADERSDLQELALAICERRVATTTANANAADNDDSGSDDWFSDHVLNGEPADKPGNKRLERRRRQ